MNPTRKRRVWLLLAVLAGVAVATSLTLAALGSNVQLFMSPSDVQEGKAPAQRSFRLGGVVLEHSTQRDPQSLQVRFTVTDRFHETPVRYDGILPDLYKEGQSVVATGTLGADGVFVADTVLAKHDENYMPPEVADAIARAKARGQRHPGAAPATAPTDAGVSAADGNGAP